MPIVVAKGVRKAYGARVLLDGADFSIHARERVGVVGVNGSGKTTFARLLAGLDEPDAGEVVARNDATVVYLAQEPALPSGVTAVEAVLAGLGAWSAAVARHAALSEALAAGEATEARLRAQAEAAAEVERLGGWDREREAIATLGHLGVRDPGRAVDTMSGGERRRVALARVLVEDPTLAILDEPTNHLDIDTIEWLERYLAERYRGALLLITHDRYVLDHVVERTVEVDRGQLYTYDGGWEAYLVGKSARLEHQARAEANRQNLLRTELEWLRRGPKARGTKQRARVERAEAARDQAAPEAERSATFALQTTRLGKTVVELRGVGLTLGDRRLIDGLDLDVTRGERIGVVGDNGTGKTSLLRMLLGELRPTEGEVRLGQSVQLAYLDQARARLRDDASIVENVAGGERTVEFAGRAMDARTYLARFTFEAARVDQPVSALSGGERARVALAKLLLQPANVLLLDEPTNDLDVTTLAALEQMLVAESVTAIVVSHDRYFLDRVATSVLVFEGGGRVVRYPGGYGMYRTLRAQAEQAEQAAQADAVEAAASRDRPAARADGATAAPVASSAPRKLSYKDKRELEGMEASIAAAEATVADLDAQLADPGIYVERADEVPALVEAAATARAEVERLVARWIELEERRG